jgi:hypothetical protein
MLQSKEVAKKDSCKNKQLPPTATLFWTFPSDLNRTFSFLSKAERLTLQKIQFTPSTCA